jgi:ABC-type molybdenum transport system ATPase subunit/photorepair protein PhrA
LTLFGKPRRKLATSTIQQNIGLVSPEIFNAFPRRIGPGSALSLREAIATGFDSTFSYRPRTKAQDLAIDILLAYFDTCFAVSPAIDDAVPFAGLSIGEQSLALLLRALVGRPKLLLLDEVFAGMDDHQVTLAKQYVREELKPEQAVVFISHWDEEIPWSGSELKQLRLGS